MHFNCDIKQVIKLHDKINLMWSGAIVRQEAHRCFLYLVNLEEKIMM